MSYRITKKTVAKNTFFSRVSKTAVLVLAFIVMALNKVKRQFFVLFILAIVISFLLYYSQQEGKDTWFYLSVNKNESTTDYINLDKTEEWLDRTGSVGFQDYGNEICPVKHDVKIFTDLITKWTELANKHNLRYFLDAGTLLGAWRHQSFIPYDQDIDVAVHENDLKTFWDSPLRVKFRVLNSSRKDPAFYLLFSPDWRSPYHNRTRYTCQGHATSQYVDICSFTDPPARLIHKLRHIDLYVFKERNNSTFEFWAPRDSIDFKKKDFFPLVKCNLSGIEMQCPRNVKPLLSSLYRTFEPNYVCVNGKWRNRLSRQKQASPFMRITLYTMFAFIIMLALALYSWRRHQ